MNTRHEKELPDGLECSCNKPRLRGLEGRLVQSVILKMTIQKRQPV